MCYGAVSGRRLMSHETVCAGASGVLLSSIRGIGDCKRRGRKASTACRGSDLGTRSYLALERPAGRLAGLRPAEGASLRPRAAVPRLAGCDFFDDALAVAGFVRALLPVALRAPEALRFGVRVLVVARAARVLVLRDVPVVLRFTVDAMGLLS